MNGGWTPDELLIEHGAFLRRIVRSLLRCDDLAEDIVQETVLARVPPAIREPGRMRGWLAGIARHKAISLQRSVQRRRRREQWVARSEETPSHETSIEQLELQRVLIETVQSLPGPIRSTLVLHYLEELTTAEIAERHEVSLEKVRWRIRRGLALVRDRLDRERHDWRVALLPIAFPGFRTAASKAADTTHAARKPRMRLRSRRAFQVWGSVAILGVAWMLWEGFRANSLPSLGQEQLGEVTSDTGKGSRMAHAGPAYTEAVPVLEASADLPSEPAADTSAPTEGRLVLNLRCGDDPVADVDVWVIRDEKILLETRADAEGRLTATAFGGEGALYVHGPARGPEVVKVSLEPGQRQVPLDACSEVSGRLIFEEAPREFPKTIALESDQLWKAHFDLPGPLRARAGLSETGEIADIPVTSASLLEATIQPDGSFRFAGLPADWHGCVVLPDEPHGLDLSQPSEGCGWADDSHHLPLSSPQTRLEIQTLPHKSLWGRIMRQPRGKLQTQDWVHVDLVCQCDESPELRSHDVNLYSSVTEQQDFFAGLCDQSRLPDADDCDSANLPQDPLHLLSSTLPDGRPHFTIEVTVWTHSGSVRFTVEPNKVGSDGYLGEFDLGSTREIPFVVHDEHGNPLKGATARIVNGSNEVLTDSQGLGTLSVLRSAASEAGFLAPGYHARTVALKDHAINGGKPLVVELPRSTLLRLEFAKEADVPSDLSLTAVLWSEKSEARIRPRVDRWSKEKWSHTFIFFPANEDLELTHLPPGVPFRMLLLTSDGALVEEIQFSPFCEEEHRTLTRPLRLPLPRTLELYLLDSEGRPVAGEQIGLVASTVDAMKLQDECSLLTISCQTDSLGRLVAGPLYSDSYRIGNDVMIELSPDSVGPRTITLR
ncbi:MAG: RNA polymerase sigma factor [Planctomycetota bacterium]